MPQIADRKSMARYICVDKGATHPALQREELPKHIQHLAKQKHNLTRIHTLGYIEEPQFIERSAAIEQQIRERKQQLSRNDMSNTSEKILQKTRLIQKKLSSTPPLELFDESVFKELVKKVLISNTAIQFELINGMKLSESRAATCPESFYSSIVSKIILHLDTHIDIKLRNGQTL